jgi:hypothetical protein
MQPSNELWYGKVKKTPTISIRITLEYEGFKCLFRDYISYVRVVGVVIRESAVGVPLRWVCPLRRDVC